MYIEVICKVLSTHLQYMSSPCVVLLSCNSALSLFSKTSFSSSVVSVVFVEFVLSVLSTGGKFSKGVHPKFCPFGS